MREFVKYIMLLIVGMVPVSCVFDADRCIVSTDEPHDVMFTVSLEGQHTRATWGEGYLSEEGVPFDKRIIPENLCMVILAPDGTRLGEIRDMDYWAIDEAHTIYQLNGQLPAEVIKHINTHSSDQKEYKFMVLANCGSNMSGEEYITYSHTQLNPSNENASIPMWGVIKADVSPLYEADHLDLGEIELLRAAAKVEVKLSDKFKDKSTTITSATLKYYNQTGYVLPSGWSQVSYTKGLDQENCLRVYRHAAVNLPFIKDEATGNYYVYVTEYDNINYSGERNKISLEFNVGGETKYFEDAISFCQYSNGAPVENSYYSIVRNHIYEFEILSIAGSNLTLEYTVADWDIENWGGNDEDGVNDTYKEHDLSYPTYHNPVVPYEFLSLSADKQANYVIKQEPTMYYGGNDNLEAGAFHCYFQILAPATVQWKPVFMSSKESYQIRVYAHDGSLIYDTDDKSDRQDNLGICGANEWYHIVVFPLSDGGAGETNVDFGISYYQVWTDQYINLYVNGEYDNIKWPNSGNNPKLINIKHVSAQ